MIGIFVAAVNRQRAVIGDIAGHAAGGAAITQLQGAAIDGGAAAVGVIGRKD
ncbi:hypothetical protein D3C81_2154810 [compost metagenome]